MERSLTSKRGQVISEIIVSLAIGAVFITVAAAGIALYIRQSHQARMTQIAGSLTQEYFDQLKSIAESNWSSVYNPPASKGEGSQFFITPTSTSYEVAAGTTTTTREGQTFIRYFSIENVNRESCGIGRITPGSVMPCSMQSGAGYVAEDPLTQKITVIVSWGNESLAMPQYLTRARTRSWVQTDWSGGAVPGQEAVRVPVNTFAASTNIDIASSTGSIYLSSGAQNGNLTSAVFDASSTAGIAMNNIFWLGAFPSGASVRFQATSSNCPNGESNPPACNTGSWDFIGPDGSATTYYIPSDADTIIPLNPQHHANKRYFRYKVFLSATEANGPRVDDIVIGLSR